MAVPDYEDVLPNSNGATASNVSSEANHPPNNSASNAQSQQTGPAPAEPDQSDPKKDHETYLKGKPKAVGIVVIVTSIVQLGFAIAFCFNKPIVLFYTGIAFWGPLLGIITGALTIAAAAEPNTSMIKSSINMNAITSIMQFLGAVFTGIDIPLLNNGRCNFYHYNQDLQIYEYHCSESNTVTLALVLAVLIMNFLLFIVTLTFSVFEHRSLKHLMATPVDVSYYGE